MPHVSPHARPPTCSEASLRITRFDARLCALSDPSRGWQGRLTQRFRHAAVAERAPGSGAGNEPGGPAGGVAGDVAGGVAGDEAGGVAGGVAGDVAGGVAGDEAGGPAGGVAGVPSRITLLHPGRPLVPWGIALPEAATPAWSGFFAEGDRVALRGRTLTLHSAAMGSSHRFTLVGPGVCLTAAVCSSAGVRPSVEAQQASGSNGAPGTFPALARLPHRLAALPLAPRTRALLAPHRCRGDDLSARGLRCAGERLAALLDALDANAPPEPAHVARCVRALVGLGPGSTPTGDDLLVGALAGAWHLAALDRRSARLRDRLGEAVASLDRTATTPTAWEMLQEATRGAFPEPLLRLARLLGDRAASDGSLAAATRALTAMGGHSGADLAAGLVGLVGLVGLHHRLAATPRVDGGTPRDALCERLQGESE